MENLVTKDQSHLLWRDELYYAKGSTKHTFIILKYGEIYRYSEDLLTAHIWKKSVVKKLEAKGIVEDKCELDDLDVLFINVKHLPYLISLGNFKRRIPKNSKWLKSREELLAHKILTV